MSIFWDSSRFIIRSASHLHTNISLQGSLYRLAIGAPAIPGGHPGTCSLHFCVLKGLKMGDWKGASRRLSCIKPGSGRRNVFVWIVGASEDDSLE